jgi:hypothetical protein
LRDNYGIGIIDDNEGDVQKQRPHAADSRHYHEIALLRQTLTSVSPLSKNLRILLEQRLMSSRKLR